MPDTNALNETKPPHIVTSWDCLKVVVAYFGFALPLFLLMWFSWDGAKEFVVLGVSGAAWLAYFPIRAARDFRAIRPARKAFLLTDLEKQRRVCALVRWGAWVSVAFALTRTVQQGLFYGERLTASDAAPGALPFLLASLTLFLAAHGFVSVLLWRMAKELRAHLQIAERDAAFAAAVPETVVPNTVAPPKHWWTSADARDAMQETRRVG